MVADNILIWDIANENNQSQWNSDSIFSTMCRENSIGQCTTI